MMQRILVSVAFVIFSATLVAGQVPFFGKCPTPPVQTNFDLKRFMGEWYEIERTFSVLGLGSQCVSTNYSDSGYKDGSVEVLNDGFGPVIKLRMRSRLIAKIPDPEEPAKMKLRLTDLSLKTNYWILNTDYDNYAVIWACNHIWLTLKHTRTENMWILSRKRTLPEETLSSLHAYIGDIKGIITGGRLLRKVHQGNCD